MAARCLLYVKFKHFGASMGSEEREADGGPVHLVLYSHPSAKKKKKKKKPNKKTDFIRLTAWAKLY